MGDKKATHWPITLTNGAAALVNLFLPLLLVRILTPDQVGRYKVFFLYVMLSPSLFLVTGLNNGLYHWAGDYPRTKPEIRQSWTLMWVITVALCALGAWLSPWIAHRLQLTVIDLRLLLLCIPFIMGSAFVEDFLISRGDIWTGSIYGSGFNVFRAVSLALAAWWTRSMEWVIYVFVAGMLIRVATGWWVASRSGELSFTFDWQRARKVMRYAFPVSVAAMSARVIQNVDQVILSSRLLATQFAFYSMGCLSIQPLDIFEMSVNRVMIPRLSRSLMHKDRAQAAEIFSEGSAELFRFLLPAAVGLTLFAYPIIHLLFTAKYQGAAMFLQVFAWSYLLHVIPVDALARARGDGGWILRTYIAFSLLSIGLTWWAAGRWGAMGALGGVLASQLMMRLYTVFDVRRHLNLPFSAFLPIRTYVLQSILVTGIAGICWFVRPLFATSLLWFLVMGPLFAVVYLSGTYALYVRERLRSHGTTSILELTQTVKMGGLERMIYSLSNELRRSSRFQVLVAIYDHSDQEPSLAPQFEQAGIQVARWKKGRGFSWMSVFRLLRLIFSDRIRIVHAHNLGPLIYGSIVKCLSLGYVKLVVTLHSTTDFQQKSRYRLYFNYFLRFADRIIAVSEAVQSHLLKQGIPADKIEVIPNGVVFTDARKRPIALEQKYAWRKDLLPNARPDLIQARWLLCLARIHPGKGHDVVLQVWSALSKEVRSRLALLFVGQETYAGHQQWLAQKINEVPDSDRIMVVGPSEVPDQWLQVSDLFVSGSMQEGMPLAPLEAVGSGLPTILSDIEGHHFLKSWAQYFDVRNPAQGAAQIIDVLKTIEGDAEDESFRTRWDAASALRQKWSAPVMTASYVETFKSA